MHLTFLSPRDLARTLGAGALPLLLLLIAGCAAKITSDGQVDLTCDSGPDARRPDGPREAAAPDAGRDLGADSAPDAPRPDAHLAPAHATCATPATLTLTGGSTTVVGSTRGASNELSSQVSCGHPLGPWPGPQVYYRVALEAGKSFRASLRPGFDGALYAFPAATACSASAVHAACAAAGIAEVRASDQVGAGASELLRLVPTKSEDWIVVVDSYAAGEAGTFALTVAEVVAPANGTCATAQTLAVGSSATVVSGDTSSASQELAVTCGAGITLSGPQVYYRFAALAGTTYRLALRPSFAAHLYLFRADAGCTAASVQAACQSQGANGAHLGPVSPGSTRVLEMAPATSGDYIVAVDSTSASSGGPFQLTLQGLTPPAHGKCAAPSVLSSIPTSVTGSTAGARDEISTLSCAGASALDGPQVYYAASLSGGTTYRLLLRPSFLGALYIFPGSAGCTEAAIASACASGGATGDALAGPVLVGGQGSLYFKPPATATYIIAVDSYDVAQAGAFTLELAPAQTSGSATCAQTTQVQLASGKASLSGDTYGAPDEFSSLTCGGSAALDGPQVYYGLSMLSGQSYRLRLEPSFEAHLVVAGPTASCSAGALDKACGAPQGALLGPVPASGAQGMVFTPTTNGAHRLVVESTASGLAGAFRLQVEAFQKPAHAQCVSPKSLSLPGASGSLTEPGDTTGVGNDLGVLLTCGTPRAFAGPQLFYRLSLVAGRTYTIQVAPQGWDAAIYLFTDTTCTPAIVESQCAWPGQAADDAPAGASETLSVTPGASQDYLVAVDSATKSAAGPFTLTVSWK